MKIRAVQKYSRQSPRKVREVANQIKKLSLTEAITQLALVERKGSEVILKVLRQAIANAIHNHHLAFADLVIESILVETGPSYKRFRSASRGRGHQILKRVAHVQVILATKEGAKTSAANAEPESKAKTSTSPVIESEKEAKTVTPKVAPVAVDRENAKAQARSIKAMAANLKLARPAAKKPVNKGK